eukprot:TRINITY_DN24112_c0_g1_i2.p1 TRINITY_DN24112_c0_g1~~TRINITY_DN24112_c0_g1_i2.p1  ORF type:complete len:308 (+),score=20.70 TRINITY_DN24112_c0_g1_i2:153-1076(+)
MGDDNEPSPVEPLSSEDAGPCDGEDGSAQTEHGTSSVPERFHIVPRKGWDRFVRGMGCGARNTLPWKGIGPVPIAENPCWLLPSSDDTSIRIAERQAELIEAGWLLFTCAPEVVRTLNDKARLWEHASRLDLARYLPRHYSVTTPADASYPCILKSATGEFGKDCHIVRCEDDVRHHLSQRGAARCEWLLQELIAGKMEYSVSLIVQHGKILESACTQYEYDRDEYVYPNVKQVRKMSISAASEHLSIMERLLEGYTGICNFNYKLANNSVHELRILEVNTRVGGDLAVDVPRDRARELYERVDSLR